MRLVEFAPSRDARYAVYAVSRSGSDSGSSTGVLDSRPGPRLPDRLEWVKVSSAAWSGKGSITAAIRCRLRAEALSSSNEHHRVFYHRLGTPGSRRAGLRGTRGEPLRFHLLETTEDERFEILYVYDRAAGKKGNAVFLRDRHSFRPAVRAARGLRSQTTRSTSSVTSAALLLVQTDKEAPKGQNRRHRPGKPAQKDWKSVVAERQEPYSGHRLPAEIRSQSI